VHGIDEALSKFGLDAVVTATDKPGLGHPTCSTATTSSRHFEPGGRTGYPIIQVPAGMVFGIPLGVSFFQTAFGERKLNPGFWIEAVTQVRRTTCPPSATVPDHNISGPR